MNPEFQEPAITYLPSLNSIKRNIVSENRTSFVVSNRGLNLSFIAIHHLSSLFITRLQIPSASRFLFQALPILRIRHRDKDTRRMYVCVYMRSYVWKIHDYRSQKKVYRRREMHRTCRRKRRPRRNRKSVERKAILPDETSATVFRST